MNALAVLAANTTTVSSSADLSPRELERIPDLLRGQPTENFVVHEGSVLIHDGRTASLNGIVPGESSFVLEFHPVAGQHHHRTEFWVFGADGDLTRSFATQFSQGSNDGHRPRGIIPSAINPIEHDGRRLLRLLGENTRAG